MIKYELKCRKDHVFEAWFYDSATYDKQAAGGKVVCPVCGSRKVTKAPMAPRIGRSKADQAAEHHRRQQAQHQIPWSDDPWIVHPAHLLTEDGFIIPSAFGRHQRTGGESGTWTKVEVSAGDRLSYNSFARCAFGV